MSRVPQANGGGKSNLAKALAADTREAGSASGRTSDKGWPSSRSRSPRRAVPLHAAWKHDTVLSRAVVRSPRSAEDPEGGVSCDRDHDAHVRHLFLKNKISGLEAFNASVAAPASGARGVADVAGAGHSDGLATWPEMTAEPFLKDVDMPNVYWARIPCKDLATGAAKTRTWCPFFLLHEVLASLAEKNVGDVSSFAAIPQQQRLGCPAQLLCQARHQGRLDAGLGSPQRRHRTPEAQDCGVLLLERAGLSRRRTLLVRFGGEGRVVSFGTVAVPTLCSTEATLTHTEATLTPTEARVGNAKCLELTTETGILLRVRVWRQVRAGCCCGHFLLQHEAPSGGVVAIGAARPGAVTGHRQSAGCSWSQEGGCGVPRVAAPSAARLGLVLCLVRLQRVGVPCKANCSDIPWTDTSSAAAWRTSRYRTSESLARQTEQGINVNPLLSLPGFSAELICIDVLHSMDLGTTQDAIGNVFFDLVAGQGGTQVCVSALVCLCVRLCSACMSSCVWSPLQALDSSARSRGAAGLLSCGTGSNFTARRSTRNPSCSV